MARDYCTTCNNTGWKWGTDAAGNRMQVPCGCGR